jgi:hypothetical protein
MQLSENVCAPLVTYVMTPLEVVLGRVEKYHAPELLSGAATQQGVAVNAVANECAVVTVPEALVTDPTCTLDIVARLEICETVIFPLLSPSGTPAHVPGVPALTFIQPATPFAVAPEFCSKSP